MVAKRKPTKAMGEKAFAESIQRFLGLGIEAEQVDPDQYNEACNTLLEYPHFKVFIHQLRQKREDYIERGGLATCDSDKICAFTYADAYKEVISDTLFAAKAYVESAVEVKKQNIS